MGMITEMNFLSFIEKIGLSPEAQQEVLKLRREKHNWSQQFEWVTSARHHFLAWSESTSNQASVLTVILEWAWAQRNTFDSDTAFIANTRDISLWSSAYFDTYGEVGLMEVEWVLRSIDHEIIRIGRLQFEPSEYLDEDLIVRIGTPILWVHVPADGSLDYRSCVHSISKASKRWPGRPMFCDSWLLTPALRKLLPSTSNILAFQKLFTVYAINPLDPQAIDRVFGFNARITGRYPTKTVLQSKMKEFMEDGGYIGTAKGFRLQSK